MEERPLLKIWLDIRKDLSAESAIAIDMMLDVFIDALKEKNERIRISPDTAGEILVALIMKGYRPVYKKPISVNKKQIRLAKQRRRRLLL